MRPRSELNMSGEMYRRCVCGKNLAFAAVDGPANLARLLGISKQATSNWDIIPAERVLEVERATGVYREKLRPDFYNFEDRRDRKRRRA